MTLLIWLAASSLVWGGVLWIAGRALQRSTNVSGAARQWIWRGATALLLAPWIAAPFVVMFGLGLAPAENMAATVAAAPMMEMHAMDAANVETAVVSNGGGILAWLGQASLPELVIAVFIAGWVVRFVLAQLALRSLLGIVNLSREADPGVAKSFVQAWAERLKLRPAPRLRIVAEQHSPFSFGILRPTICVPEGMEEKLSRGSLNLVVGHESLHIARGDGWLRPVERVTADILWFNPFAWLIRRELDVARELAVDEAVLAMSQARVAYARTLRDVAGFAAGLPANAPAASMSLPGGRNLMMRVSRTLAHAGQKPARAAVIAACLLGLVGAPIAIAQVVLAVPRAPQPPAAPAVEQVEPVEPVAPTPPVAESQVYVSPDGMVRASFAATVTSAGAGKKGGYSVSLEGEGRTSDGEMCRAVLDGLGGLDVTRGQSVARGQAIGKRGNGGSLSFTVHCTDEVDAAGKPVFPSAQLTPVAPPAPLSRPSQVAAPAPLAAPTPMPHASMVAPLAPLSPATPKPMRAPLAPPAPLSPVTPAPMIAPIAPTPVTPMAPMVAPTPPAPVTPTTPMVAPTPPPRPPGWNSYQPTAVTPPPLKTSARAVIQTSARVTSGYGQRVDPISQKQAFHDGVDIAAPSGSAVHSPVAGQVIFAGVKGERGNSVEVLAANGQSVSFAQLGSVSVKVGAAVAVGDVVGTVGSSGRSTGAHLHLGVTVNGDTQDPAKVEGLALIAG